MLIIFLWPSGVKDCLEVPALVWTYNTLILSQVPWPLRQQRPPHIYTNIFVQNCFLLFKDLPSDWTTCTSTIGMPRRNDFWFCSITMCYLIKFCSDLNTFLSYKFLLLVGFSCLDQVHHLSRELTPTWPPNPFPWVAGVHIFYLYLSTNHFLTQAQTFNNREIQDSKPFILEKQKFSTLS